VVGRAPVITKETIKVDDFVRLSVLCPNGMTDLHSDLSADLDGCSDISILANLLMSVRMGKINDILALCWCPGVVVLLL